ncbi:MAG: outer membrane beta-barrel protein [Bdellovibrionota bacterium]
MILPLLVPGLAKAEQAGWVGGLFGLSIPNADQTTSRGAFGITGGAKLGSEWGIGGYYLTSHKDETGGKFGYDLYGIEFAYHFEGEAAGVYLGGRVGTSKITSGAITTSPTNYGAVAGFNHFLSDHVSLGGELNFFSVPESTSTATTVKGFTMLNFLAAAKFWF